MNQKELETAAREYAKANGNIALASGIEINVDIVLSNQLTDTKKRTCIN